MRKIFLVFLFLPFIGLAQSKNVLSTFRIFPKVGKSQEFEKAFIAHAQKYHTGNWKWRVFEIQSGPDQGGFHVVEGPLSWDEFDKRGNLGAAHTADFAKNVEPNMAERGTASYSQFDETLSTVKLTDYADKIIINHIYPKPGMIVKLEELLVKMKGAWTAGNESVAVYRAIASGEPQIITVTRMKAGLKEMDESFRKPFPARYNEVNGSNSWTDFLKTYADAVERRWSELLFYRADLSK